MNEEIENIPVKENKKHTGRTVRRVLLFIAVFILGASILVAIPSFYKIIKLREEAMDLVSGCTADTFRQTETSIVYDVNGNVITTLSAEKELYYLDDSKIPEMLKEIFVYIEDRDFYKHGGVDYQAIGRAALANMKHDTIVQGASTITQQVAKNVFLTQEVTWDRKITEMFIAIELEKKFTKDQILGFYVNNIYFANGYYGIEAAAKGYFGKSVRELTLSQMVYLAGIPQSPARYDPVDNYESSIQRRDFILGQLLDGEIITQDQYNAAINEDIKITKSKRTKNDYIDTYVYYCATRALMEENGFVFQYDFSSKEEQDTYNDLYDYYYSTYQASLFTSGYRIYTSIDLSKQKLLQNAVNTELAGFTNVNKEGIYNLQASAVCIDNSNGFVTAIVGGREQNFKGYTLNRAYQSYRQPGSSIKPLIVYAPYMMKGHNPDETIDDSPFKDGPSNVGNKYHGIISLYDALGYSSNVCAWKIYSMITPEYGFDFLHEMNFKKLASDEKYMAPCIGGFTYGVSSLEMASAYATLENDGIYRAPTCIMYITDAKNNEVASNMVDGTEVYSKNASRKVTSMLKYCVTNGILRQVALDNAIVAAKSGTTDDSKDGWLVGYSRYYTTAVWVGNDIPSTVEGLSGGSYPANIWKNYMQEIHKGLEVKDFEQFSNEDDIDNEDGTVAVPENQPSVTPGTDQGNINNNVPALDGNNTGGSSVSGGDSNAPVGGGDSNVPSSGGDSNVPSSGGDSNAPVGGGDSNAPVGGGDSNAPVGGGDSNAPVGGGDSNAPAGGGDSNAVISGGDRDIR